MGLKESMNILLKTIKDCHIIGYWDKGDSYAFKVALDNDTSPYSCTTFIVTRRGEVQCTNPVIGNLLPETMIKVR